MGGSFNLNVRLAAPFVLILLFSSCRSGEFISNSAIQKRKHLKGFHLKTSAYSSKQKKSRNAKNTRQKSVRELNADLAKYVPSRFEISPKKQIAIPIHRDDQNEKLEQIIANSHLNIWRGIRAVRVLNDSLLIDSVPNNKMPKNEIINTISISSALIATICLLYFIINFNITLAILTIVFTLLSIAFGLAGTKKNQYLENSSPGLALGLALLLTLLTIALIAGLAALFWLFLGF